MDEHDIQIATRAREIAAERFPGQDVTTFRWMASSGLFADCLAAARAETADVALPAAA